MLHILRAGPHRLQFLPQPALPEVSEPGARRMARRPAAELLPVPYFHVVFTLPAPVTEIGLQNKAMVYATLFRAAAETLRTVDADPKDLGAKIVALPQRPVPANALVTAQWSATRLPDLDDGSLG